MSTNKSIEPTEFRIATITADEPHHRYLTALLAGRFNVVGTIVEPCARRRRRLWQQRRFRSWGWFAYHYWRRTLTGLDRYRRNFFEHKISEEKVFAKAKEMIVDSINDPIAVAAIQEWNPEVVILCGTSIMRQEMLKACGPNLLNIHGGYLPYYKGNHCFFFAMYENHPEYLGSTIHFVNQGIDTGNIIENVQVPVEDTDTPETQYCKCEWKAFQRLASILEGYATNRNLPEALPQITAGKEYRMRDRTPWVELKWILRKKKSAV